MPVFLNPALLWGLAAAAVPVAIHLLHRRRFQRQRWAAMEWLLAAAQQNKRRLQMENLLLLAARTLAVLFLALALTRPSFSDSALLLGTTPKTHLYVLLDNSASMAARTGTHTAFDDALTAVSSLVAPLADDDPVTLVLTNDNWGESRHTGRPRAILRETRDHGAVRRRLGELKPAAARADLADALRTLDEMVQGASAMLRRVAVVTDLQAVTVEGVREREKDDDPIRSVLERLRQKGAEVVLVPVGRDTPNVAVTALRPADDRDVVQGAAAVFHAEIRNFSDRPQKVEVKFTVDGESRGESSQFVTVAPRTVSGQPSVGTAQYWTTFTDKDTGSHVLEARIQTDAFTLDDVRSLAFSVRPAIQVLLVDGDPAPGQGREPEVRWLERAVGLEKSGPFAARVITEDSFHAMRTLEGWDLVVLANVRRPAPSEDARKKLDEFVRNGGALFLTVGNQVDPSRWNEEIYRIEGGLLPAKLGPARVDPTAVQRFDLSVNRHPIFADITDPANASFFEPPAIHGYLTTQGLDAEKGTRTVLTLKDLAHTPILLERRTGRGAVLLYLSTIDDDWGRLLGSYLFPVFVHQTIHHLTSRGNADRNVQCFQSWSRTVPPNLVSMEITRPDGSAARIDRDVSGDASTVSYSETESPGVYRALGTLKPTSVLEQTPPPLRDAFAVFLTPLESDLRRVSSEEAFRRWNGLVASGKNADDGIATAKKKAGEIAFPLVALALLMLLVENHLVQRIGRRRT